MPQAFVRDAASVKRKNSGSVESKWKQAKAASSKYEGKTAYWGAVTRLFKSMAHVENIGRMMVDLVAAGIPIHEAQHLSETNPSPETLTSTSDFKTPGGTEGPQKSLTGMKRPKVKKAKRVAPYPANHSSTRNSVHAGDGYTNADDPTTMKEDLDPGTFYTRPGVDSDALNHVYNVVKSRLPKNGAGAGIDRHMKRSGVNKQYTGKKSSVSATGG